MAATWVNVAEGSSFSSLSQLVGNQDLPKGTPVLVKMNVGAFAYAFDLPGAELAFQPFVPPGMDLRDVYGEGSYGYVKLESDPTSIGDMVSYIITFWGDILLSAVRLVTKVVNIVISAFIEWGAKTAWNIFSPVIILSAVAIGGVLLIKAGLKED